MSGSNIDIAVHLSGFDDNQLGQFGLEVSKKAVKLTATEMWGNIGREAPVDEGRLAGSFDLQPRGDLIYAISSNTAYAEVVQTGRGPIEAAPGKVLAFEVNGQMVFVKRVGPAPPNPYIDRAREATESRIPEFVQTAIAQTIGAS